MSSNIFKIYKDTKELNKESYVTLTAAKGKKENSVIYINMDAFSYIEGLIWDKYREYGSSKKVKISSDDWKRILEGIVVASNTLTASVEELEQTLKFEIYSPANDLTDLLGVLDTFKSYLQEFVQCMNQLVLLEKYIIIQKK